MKSKRLVTAVSFFLMIFSLGAQKFATEHIVHDTSFVMEETYSVEDLSWVEGYWTGTGLGGECEEIWSTPKSGYITGIFRYFREGNLVFSEHMSIQDTEKGIGLLVKHFSPEFHAWEEEEDYINFRLAKIEDKIAYFHGLTIDGREEDKLLIYVLMKSKDGERWEEKFDFSRK